MGISWIIDQGFWAIKTYRVSHWLYQNNLKRVAVSIQMLSRWITNIDIHPSAVLGTDINIPHGLGIVIGQKVLIGNKVTILQHVTIGAKYVKNTYTEADMPIVEDNVLLGAGSRILGGVKIGSHSIVGANSVVLQDVPQRTVAVGIPARIISKTSSIV